MVAISSSKAKDEDKKQDVDLETVSPPRAVKLVGVYRSSSNFVNAVLGSGILNIPKALEKTGFFTGVFLLFFVALISDFISIQMVKMAEIKRVKNFEELSKETWGPAMFYIACVFNFLFPFGALVVYTNIINDIAKSVFSQYFPSKIAEQPFLPALATIGAFILIVTPLSCLKDLALLSFTSILSILTFGLIMAITIGTGFRLGQYRTSFGALTATDFLSAFGSLSFAFVTVDIVFPVYEGLENKTHQRWGRVTHLSIGFLSSIYATFSIFCYFLFPDLDDYVLNSKSITSLPEIVACKVLLALTLILTYPVVLHVARSYVFSICEQFAGNLQELPSRKFYSLHFTLTFLIISLSLALGIFLQKLGLVITLTGLVSSTIIGFVIPVLIIFKVKTLRAVTRDFRSCFRRRLPVKTSFEKVMNLVFPILILLFGVVGFFVGTPLTVIDSINKSKK